MLCTISQKGTETIDYDILFVMEMYANERSLITQLYKYST